MQQLVCLLYKPSRRIWLAVNLQPLNFPFHIAWTEKKKNEGTFQIVEGVSHFIFKSQIYCFSFIPQKHLQNVNILTLWSGSEKYASIFQVLFSCLICQGRKHSLGKKDMKITQVPTNGWMDKKVVIFIYLYLSISR